MIRTSASTLALILALSPLAALAGTSVDVKVTGMTCGSCVQRVSEELAKVSEIEKGSVSVMLEGNHASLVLKNNDEKSRKAVTDAITKAGFTVAKIDVVKPGAKATKTN